MISPQVSARQAVRFALAAGSLTLFLLICLPLFRGRLHGGVDLTQNDFPTRIQYAHGLRQGRLNLWNPQLFRGYRLHGEGQTGMCHPWHLLMYRFLPPAAALWLDLVTAFPLGFLGAWLLFRSWGRSCEASLFAASVFVFSSFFFAHFGHMSLLFVHAHLPWFLLAVAAAARGHGRRCALALAGVSLVVGSALLGGHPQAAWMLLFAGALYAAICTPGDFFAWPRVRRGLALAAAVGVGVLLGMIQILPTLAALARSPRGALGPGMRYNFSLHPANILQALHPFFFAQTTVGNDLVPAPGLAAVFHNNIAEFSVYGGCVLLSLIGVFWLVRGRELLRGAEGRRAWFLLSMAVLGCALSLGRAGGVFTLLGAVPLVREFRCAARYSAYVHFACAAFAAFAMDWLLSVRRAPVSRRVYVALPCFSAVLALVGSLGHVLLRDPRWLPSPWFLQLIGPLCVAVVMVLVWASQRRPGVLAVLALLCLVDLGVFGLRIILPVPDIPLTEVSALYRAYHQPPPVNGEMRLQAPANSGVWQGFYLANGYCGMPPDEPLAQLSSPLQALRLASVGLVLTEDGWQSVPDTLPRFRLAGEIRHESPGLEAQTDPAAVALLSEPDLPLPQVEPGRGTIQLLEEIPTRLLLQVDSETRQVLVCSDRFDPDWRVEVNGTAAPLLPLHRAALRGVVIPPGRSMVCMYYAATAFRAGRRLTVAGMVILIAFCTWSWRRRR